MSLAAILVFLSIIFIFLAISSFLFKPKVDVKKRMNSYITTVTAVINDQQKEIEKKQPGQSEAVKQLRGALEKVGKNIGEKDYIKQIEMELQKGDIPLRGYEFIFLIIFTTIAAIGLLAVINPQPISMAVAGLKGFFAPILYMRIKQQRKLQKFNAQIGDALVLISNSLKAGYGFLQAMDMVAKEMPPPIQTEFGRVLQEINLGMTTEEALMRLPQRVNSKDLDLVVTAMLIQRQIGGNLSEILDNISFTIRERIRIKGEVKTLTAQGRLSGMIIGALPVALGAFLLLVNPKYITQLFTDPRGQMMLVYAGVAETIAILIIKKIITIKV